MQTQHQCTKLSAVLHDESKPGEETSEYDSQTVAASKVNCCLGTALGGGSCCSCRSSSSSQTGIDDASSSGGGTGRDCGRGLSRRCGCAVHSCWVLGTTGVLSPAVTLAGCVASTSSYALGTVFSADEVWKGLRVFGCIGLLSISADAVVGQSGWVTIVGISCCRCDSWQLKAEQRAGCHLGLAPRSSVLEGNTVWVDLVYGLRVCFEGEQESGSSNYGSSE